ncbi:MAG TPA: hypothetical protein DCQ04_16865 [Actinobacteria bacterium]|nr:hypothetical protein [Actinomycetota bacterium]
MANQASVCSAAAAAIQFFAVIATSVTVAERSNFTMELGGTIGDLVPAAKPTYPRQLPLVKEPLSVQRPNLFPTPEKPYAASGVRLG